MAQALLTRCRVFAAKAEASPGTVETLTDAEGEYNVFNFEMNEETEFNERPGQGSFSPIIGVPGPRIGRATFETEVAGAGQSGGSTDWADVLLVNCGFAVTGSTFNVVSCPASEKGLTIGDFQDGRLRRLSGSQGKVTFNFSSGNPVRAAWEFLGAYEAPSSLAKIEPDYPNVASPRFVSATATIGGTTFKFSETSLEVENGLIIRPDATAASGIAGALITNRRIMLTIDPEADAFATKDWNPDWVAGTEAVIQLVVGTLANNTITFDLPAAQLMEAPNHGDRDGILIDQLRFQANRSLDVGDDELVITLS
jgi:hypothetical protein